MTSRMFRQDAAQLRAAMLAAGIPLLAEGVRHDSVEARRDAASIDSFFVARELNEVMKRTFDVKYAELKGRSLVPVERSISPGMTTFSYKQFSMSGTARVGGDRANDIPISTVSAKEFTGKIEPIRAGYEYSLQEIQAAQSLNMPLEQRKANAARRAFETSLDTIIATGDTRFGWYGLLNQPSMLSYTVPDGASGHTAWSTKTAQEIVNDLNGLVKTIISTTNEVEKPDTIVLPVDQYTLISQLPWNSQNATNVTVLQFWLKSMEEVLPGLQVIPWFRAKGAGAAGVDRMVAYKRDPDHIFIHIPEEFTQYPVQIKGFVFQVPAQGQCSGVISPYPYSMCYGDSI